LVHFLLFFVEAICEQPQPVGGEFDTMD